MATYTRTTITLIIVNILSRGLYFLNILLINNNFTTDSNTDLLFFLLALTTNVTFYINFISQDAILPELIRLQHKENSLDSAVQFFVQLLKIYLLISTVLISLYSFFNTQFISLITDFKLITLEKNKEILLLFSPIIFFSVTTYFFGGLLSAAKKFNIVLFVGFLGNLLSIFFYWLSPEKSMLSVVLGMAIGYLIGFIGLICYTFNKIKIRLKPQLCKSSTFSQVFIKEISSNAVLSLLNILGYTAPYIALTKFPDGSLSIYSFCTQISNIPVSMVIAQIATITAVRFSNMNNTNDNVNLNKMYYKIQYKLILGMLFIGILINLLFPYILPLIIKGKEPKYYRTCIEYFSIISLSLPSIAHNTIHSKLLVAKQLIFKYRLLPATYNIIFISMIVGSSFFNSHILIYIVSITPIVYSLFLEQNVARRIFKLKSNKNFILLFSSYLIYFVLIQIIHMITK
ncbi:MAG: hypothetical protein ACK4NY_03695 [Spirosomataceae bacterium]